MNERIKLLAKTYLSHERFGPYGESTMEDYYEFYPEDLEKFAELIVRECISRIEGCAVETSPDDFVKGYNKGVSKVSSQVKQYFGVEE